MFSLTYLNAKASGRRLVRRLCVALLIVSLAAPPVEAACCCETAASACGTQDATGCGCCKPRSAPNPACCVGPMAEPTGETSHSCRCSACPSQRVPPPRDRSVSAAEIAPQPVACFSPPPVLVADAAIVVVADALDRPLWAPSPSERLALLGVWIL